MDAAKLKIREMDEAFALEEAPELISFFDKLKERIDQFDYENIKGGKTALEEYALAARNVGNQLDNVAVRSLRGLEDALVGVFMGTMSLKDAFKSMAASIISDLIRIAIKRTITGPIADAIFGPMQSVGQGYFGGITAGKAIGGPVSSNRPYMVGERGPELFVPNSNGSVVANNRLGGDTVVVNQTINLSAGVSQTVRAEVMNMMPRIMEATKGAVADAKRRGGTFAKAFA
jgi:phage-related minor tail protein